MNKRQCIEILKELRNSPSKYEQYEVKPYDVEALDYAIKVIEETAQEVPVQEQYVTIKINSNEIAKIVKDELKKQQKQLNKILFV